MGKLKNRLMVAVVSAVGVTALAPITTASAGDGSVKLHPVGGAHWQGQVGLPDGQGNANQGLVVPVAPDSASELTAGILTGLDGMPTSDLGSLSFATRALPGGIEPCWTVAFIDPDGTPGTISLDPSNRDQVHATELGGGWTQYSFMPLPDTGKITSVTIGLDVTVNPPAQDSIVLDNLTVAGHTWTFAGDNAAATDQVG
jgi:hypothetical protein